MPSRLTGFVCPTVSMVTTGHATGVEKTLLNRPYYDANTALIPSPTLSMHMFAISHWLSHHSGGWRVYVRCPGH